jgi:tetratricopeptide (TPR) repeat protein
VHNGWPARNEPGNRVEPIAKPAFKPSFKLVPGEAVYTIGSCFARNVERHLEVLGFQVPMRKLKIVDDVPEDAEDNPNIFNNYAVPSILNELEWAIDPEKPFDPTTCLLETGPGQYIDLHLTRLMKPVSLEVALERRQRIKAAMATVRNCRIIIVTLGLVEAWWDNEIGRYLNMAPLKQAQKRYPGRFELHVMSYGQCVSFLERIVALLKAQCRPDHRIVLTVSPVPLGLTFTEQDVMVANSYSKSALRAAAQEIWCRHDHVDYFPSYESVTLSNRAVAWKDDMRHVTQTLIAANVSRMVAAYTDGERDASHLLAQARAAERDRRFAAAARLYSMVVSADAGEAAGSLGLGRCLGELGDVGAAEQLLLPLSERAETAAAALACLLRLYRVQRQPARFEALLPKLELTRDETLLRELVLGCFALEDYPRVESYCQQLLEVSPRKPFGYEYLARVAQAEGRWEDAERQLQIALSHNQGRAMTYLLLGRAQRALGKDEASRDAFERARLLAEDAKPGRTSGADTAAALADTDAEE